MLQFYTIFECEPSSNVDLDTTEFERPSSENKFTLLRVPMKCSVFDRFDIAFLHAKDKWVNGVVDPVVLPSARNHWDFCMITHG